MRLFLFLIVIGCTAQCCTQPVASLSGVLTLSDAYRPTVYLVAPQRFQDIAASYMGQLVDSAQIATDGRFQFAAIPLQGEKQLFQLLVQKKGVNFVTQIEDTDPAASNCLPIVLEAGQAVSVQAKIDALQATAQWQPSSPDNQALATLRQLRHQAYDAQRSILGPTSHDETQLMAHEQALRAFRKPLIHFADTTRWLLPALVATRWVSPDHDYERVPELLYRQCQRWSADGTAPELVKTLCEKARQDQLPAMTGALIPDYALPTVSGDSVWLHALLKGHRLTLLDIWASWCFPCRKENREVIAPLLDAYEPKGLQVIGYSIDASAAAWKTAIQKDGARWLQTSHLSGDSTPFMEALRITTIPANFLLDAEGRIVAKNLHGEELMAFIARYLSE